MKQTRTPLARLALIMFLTNAAMNIAMAESAAPNDLRYLSGDWSIEEVDFPHTTSGDLGVLGGARVVGLTVLEAAAAGQVAGSLAVHRFGSHGAEIVECDLVLEAGSSTEFAPGEECDLEGLFHLEPLPEACQVLLRYAPSSAKGHDDPITVGLAHKPEEPCLAVDLASVPGFQTVELVSAAVVNGVRMNYWSGTDADGGSMARLTLAAEDGSSVTIDAKTIWQVGSAGQSMSFLSRLDVADVTGEGVPAIVLGSWHGGNCCRSFYLIQLDEEPRVLAFSSAVVDRLGWGLDDLNSDGTMELVSWGSDLFSFGCPTGIDSPLAIASYYPDLGAYLVDTRRFLPAYGQVRGDAEAVAEALEERGPPDDATEYEKANFTCAVTSELLPAIAAGLVSDDEVRQIVESVIGSGTFDEGFADALIDYVDSYPAGFDVHTAPWERLITPDQLFILSCPALRYAVDVIASGPANGTTASPAASYANANRSILAAYAERLECGGSELTSLALRLGDEPALCLELATWASTCSDPEITGTWVLLEAFHAASVGLAEEADGVPSDSERLNAMLRERLATCPADFGSCFASETRRMATDVMRYALELPPVGENR